MKTEIVIEIIEDFLISIAMRIDLLFFRWVTVIQNFNCYTFELLSVCSFATDLCDRTKGANKAECCKHDITHSIFWATSCSRQKFGNEQRKSQTLQLWCALYVFKYQTLQLWCAIYFVKSKTLQVKVAYTSQKVRFCNLMSVYTSPTVRLCNLGVSYTYPKVRHWNLSVPSISLTIRFHNLGVP